MLKSKIIFAALLAAILAPGTTWADDTRIDKTAWSLDALKVTERRVEQVVAKVMPCTVRVRSATRQGAGSGVVVSEDGLVLTAAHVTRATGKDVVVIFPDGREVKGKALGANATRDTGMVQILDKGTYPFVEMGHSTELKPNQWCVALGHASGFDPRRTPPVRWGRIVNNGRFITTDCTLTGGDSGGPLFDLDGRVIGIHSNIGVPIWQNNHVPIDAFRDGWDRMLAGETWGRMPGRGMNPNRPMLGVQFDTNPRPEGCVVLEVVSGSPAEKAGLKAGDIVLAVDGKGVKSADEAVELLGSKRVGDSVALKVRRGDASLDLTATMVRARDLGNSARPAPPGNGEKKQADAQKADKNKEVPSRRDPAQPEALRKDARPPARAKDGPEAQGQPIVVGGHAWSAANDEPDGDQTQQATRGIQASPAARLPDRSRGLWRTTGRS